MPFKHINCETLANWITEHPEAIAIVDIRDPVSFSQGHIDGARHIDNNTVTNYLSSADLSKPLIVCCYHGNSSQGAAEYFSEQGFEETYSLDGGFEEWKNKLLSR